MRTSAMGYRQRVIAWAIIMGWKEPAVVCLQGVAPVKVHLHARSEQFSATAGINIFWFLK